ncbi:MAG: D-glycero-alpha-D-manno-heptose 7-phosphate kinase [Chlamydiales bacterium]|nr:D-glycero-alpha-D-manno-heptose 7-phosphate kinase [Chlamydiales bacterium]
MTQIVHLDIVLVMLTISRTPVRISFFGGGTDYPGYYEEYQGAVLGTTIDYYTYISVKTFKSQFFDHKIRIAYSKTELVSLIDEIQHPSIRETLRHHNHTENLDIHIFSDLPARTGLGSSSSFTVGFVNALYNMRGESRTKEQLGKEACYIEQQRIGENVGSQDQLHAAYGGINLMQFGKEQMDVKAVDCDSALLEHHLMLFYTGQTRFASEIVREQIDKTKCNAAFLSEMYRMVFEGQKALESSNIELFGKLMDQSWQLKKQLSSKVTNEKIDAAYNLALQAGAIGGKLCGAGNGGFLLFVVPPQKQESVRNALKLQEVEVRLENEGSKIVYQKD